MLATSSGVQRLIPKAALHHDLPDTLLAMAGVQPLSQARFASADRVGRHHYRIRLVVLRCLLDSMGSRYLAQLRHHDQDRLVGVVLVYSLFEVSVGLINVVSGSCIAVAHRLSPQKKSFDRTYDHFVHCYITSPGRALLSLIA